MEVPVVVLSAARHDDRLPAAVGDDRLHGQRCAAAAQNQHFFIGKVDADLVGHRAKPVIVGVVAENRSVVPPDERVNASDAPGAVRKLVAKRDDVLLVGDRHVEPCPIAAQHKRFQLIGFERNQPVAIAAEFFVNQLAVTVRQPPADETEPHVSIPNRRPGTRTDRRIPGVRL